MAKEEIVLVTETYINGVFIDKTALIVKDEWGFWSYALSAFIGFFAYWLIVAWS